MLYRNSSMVALFQKSKKIFEAIFQTLIIELANKQKLIPAGHSSAGMLKKKKEKAFLSY